jgi:hypothetical protein
VGGVTVARYPNYAYEAPSEAYEEGCLGGDSLYRAECEELIPPWKDSGGQDPQHRMRRETNIYIDIYIYTIFTRHYIQISIFAVSLIKNFDP